MIQSDTAELVASLSTYREEVERKLRHMVAGFAGEVSLAASNQTVKGDSNRFYALYKYRQEKTGIAPVAGFHKGAWVFTEGNLEFNPVIYDPITMVNMNEYKAMTGYKVGDSFSIGAIGPAYGMLQSRDDIMGNTEQAIQAAYLSNLKRYYDEG